MPGPGAAIVPRTVDKVQSRAAAQSQPRSRPGDCTAVLICICQSRGGWCCCSGWEQGFEGQSHLVVIRAYLQQLTTWYSVNMSSVIVLLTVLKAGRFEGWPFSTRFHSSCVFCCHVLSCCCCCCCAVTACLPMLLPLGSTPTTRTPGGHSQPLAG